MKKTTTATKKTAASKTAAPKKTATKEKTVTKKAAAVKKTAAPKAPVKKTAAKKAPAKEKANRAARPVSGEAKAKLTKLKKAKDKKAFLGELTRQDIKDLIKLSGALDGKCSAGKGKDELAGVLIVFLKK